VAFDAGDSVRGVDNALQRAAGIVECQLPLAGFDAPAFTGDRFAAGIQQGAHVSAALACAAATDGHLLRPIDG
jgi:hypothetical protein